MKKIYVLLLAALLVIGMMPVAFAARAGPKVTLGNAERVATVAADEDVTIPNEDAIVAEEDEDTRIEMCLESLSEVRPNLGEDRLKQICRNRFVLQNADRLQGNAEKLRERAGDLMDKAQMLREKANEFRQMNDKNAFKQFDKAKDFKARVVAKGKLTQARANYAKAKVQFGEAKEKLERAKIRLEGAKNINQACKDDPESEECAAAKEELREAAKDHFISQCDIIISHIEKIQSRAESSETISDERAQTIISWAGEKIAAFESIKAELEAAEDKDAILEAAKELRDEWKDTKQDVNLYAGRIVNSQIGGILVKSKMLEVKLERTLERMDENGKDTSEVQSMVDEFHAKIEEASAAYEEALGHFDEAIGTKGEERATHIKAAQESMKTAKNALQDATSKLREILHTLKQQGAEELNEASEEVDEELEAEDVSEETAEEEDTAEETSEESNSTA